jgi:hypothetical protein
MLGRPAGATVAAAALALVLALVAAAFARSEPGLGENRPLGVAAAAGGTLRIADSRGERAILEAPALRPGGSVVGSLTIENLGAPADLALSRRQLTERLGAGGASLAGALRLRIRSLTVGAGTLVYSGPLVAMPTLNLGFLPAGAERRYRFVARLPNPGFVDDGLMGARVRFDYRWQLRRQ